MTAGSLQGRVALVTGASRGIGRAIAQRLASEGVLVAVTARTLRPGSGAYAGSLEETVDAITDVGGRALAVTADLADPDVDRGQIVEQVVDTFGVPITVLVNNAAADRHFALGFRDMSAAEFHHQVEVNVWAPWDLMLHVVDGMQQGGAGWVLNISSTAAAPKVGPPFQPNPHVGAQCLYAGSKAMLDRFTTGAAMELWDEGIAVNSLAPERAVATENAVAVAKVRPELSEPHETMAEAALALCSGDPRQLTGRVATSLSLLVELGRPVRTLDGTSLLEGWQPSDLAAGRLAPHYLTAFAVSHH